MKRTLASLVRHPIKFVFAYRVRLAATRHGLQALRAYHHEDGDAYAAAMGRLSAAHGHAGTFLACIGWLQAVRTCADVPPPGDGFYALEVRNHDDDPHGDNTTIDNPDAELDAPHDRAVLWANRMLAAVLNDDRAQAADLYAARAAEGHKPIAMALAAAAELSIAVLRDTPTGADLLRQ